MTREHPPTQRYPCPRGACVPSVHQQVRVPGQTVCTPRFTQIIWVSSPGTIQTIKRFATERESRTHTMHRP
jgi:hypothetical protein